MKIEWNKVTWYSRLLAVVVFLLTFYIAFNLGKQVAQVNEIEPIRVANNSENLSQFYENKTLGFSIQYPAGYTVDDTYQYQELGPGKDISGVKFTIPLSIKAGTNLSSDSYVSVEEIPGAINSCSAEIYLDSATPVGYADEGGHRYSVASSNGAGAGNRYEETVYATPIDGGCLAVRYFIHYGVIDNYPAGTVKEFDKQALLNQFDAIRQTLKIN